MERAINVKLNAPGLGTYPGKKNTCDQMRGAQGKALDDAARQTLKGSAYPSSARLGPKKVGMGVRLAIGRSRAALRTGYQAYDLHHSHVRLYK